MKEKCYISAKKIIGPCGPCSFINLIGLKGSAKLEEELSELGKLKPFNLSDFTSFLLWSNKYKKDIEIYVNSTKISEGLFKFIFNYEKVPKGKRKELKEKANKRHSKIVQRYKNKIKKIGKNPLEKIDELLENGYWVAFCEAHKFKNKKGLVGHFKVAYKKENGNYLIKDSAKGLDELPRKKMRQQLNNLKKMKGPYNIIAYKK